MAVVATTTASHWRDFVKKLSNIVPHMPQSLEKVVLPPFWEDRPRAIVKNNMASD
jgi:hypothetical protein